MLLNVFVVVVRCIICVVCINRMLYWRPRGGEGMVREPYKRKSLSVVTFGVPVLSVV